MSAMPMQYYAMNDLYVITYTLINSSGQRLFNSQSFLYVK